jgi:hypothetical protein
VSSIGIEATDVDRFAADVEGLGAALGDLAAANRDASVIVLGSVDAPRKTGTLDDTVEAIVTPLGWTLTAGGTRAPYAAIVHARDPFLSRALLAREDDVVDVYADHVTDTIDTHL